MCIKLSSGRTVFQRRRRRRRISPVWGPVVGRRTQQRLTLSLSLSFFVDIIVVVFVVVRTTALSSAVAVDPPQGGATRGWQGGGRTPEPQRDPRDVRSPGGSSLRW